MKLVRAGIGGNQSEGADPSSLALADKATAVEAFEKGANGFLCKPFSDRQLNEALERRARLWMARAGQARQGMALDSVIDSQAAKNVDRVRIASAMAARYTSNPTTAAVASLLLR